jgi:hypothetical protein
VGAINKPYTMQELSEALHPFSRNPD